MCFPLINRMLSSILHDKIPFHYLYPIKPTFSVVPRATRFIQNLKPELDKLQPRAKKCVHWLFS